MNKKNFFLSLVLAGAFLAAPSVYALNDGKLDNILFETRVKTTLKKDHAIDFTNPKPYKSIGTAVKFDSGNRNCYSGLSWKGVDSYQYDLVTVCKIKPGWQLVYVSSSLHELADGSIGHDWRYIYTPSSATVASPYWNSANWDEWAGYEGTLVLKAKFKNDGSLANIKMVAPQDGMIYYGYESNNIYGSGRSGFSLKQVKPDKIDPEAKACFDDAVLFLRATGTPAIVGCGVDVP